MQESLVRRAAVLIAVITTIAINGLANALPINGLTTGEISDSFAVFFVPAGYVFSIWGLIYLGLIAYAIFQARPSQADNPRLRAIAAPFLLSSVANIGWIFLWHYQQFLFTLPVMVVLLVSLIVIYARLYGTAGPEVSRAERWLVHAPFSLYLGWITVATIANATTVLAWLGWNGGPLSEATWTAIMLAVALIVAGWLTAVRRDAIYLGVLLWAFVGIAIKHAAVAAVTTAAWLSALVVVGLIFYTFRRNDNAPLPAPA